MMYEKIVLVTRKTRLEGLIERFNTRAQAKFYLEHSGVDFSSYEREHETYYRALAELRHRLQGLAKIQLIEREFLPNFLFADSDLVLTFGIDGQVVNTAKYLDGQPLIAVNPDPDHIDGILLPFTVADASDVVQRVLRGEGQERLITMALAELNNGQSLLAFNDFFIGVRGHTSARYRIRFRGREERHSSSGIIVSTGAGSTGWLSSLFHMANGMISVFGSGQERLQAATMDWDTDRLIFVVREPFASKMSSASLVCGQITRDDPLVLESGIPEGGIVFSDGVEADFLEFNAGTVTTVSLAERKTRLIVG